jgi:hypothetical protein
MFFGNNVFAASLDTNINSLDTNIKVWDTRRKTCIQVHRHTHTHLLTRTCMWSVLSYDQFWSIFVFFIFFKKIVFSGCNQTYNSHYIYVTIPIYVYVYMHANDLFFLIVSSDFFSFFFNLAPRHIKGTLQDSLWCAFRRVFFFFSPFFLVASLTRATLKGLLFFCYIYVYICYRSIDTYIYIYIHIQGSLLCASICDPLRVIP